MIVFHVISLILCGVGIGGVIVLAIRPPVQLTVKVEVNPQDDEDDGPDGDEDEIEPVVMDDRGNTFQGNWEIIKIPLDKECN